jgi:hypothetical protein
VPIAIGCLLSAAILAAQGAPPKTVVWVPGHAAPMLLDTIGVVREIPAPPHRAFAALAVVYDQLKLPVTLRDGSRRLLGNLHFIRMRNFAGQPLSRFIECGNDMTGSRADKYRVHFAILSRIDSLPDGRARIRSSVVAGAEDVMGSAKEPIACGSTGALEARIINLVIMHAKAS